MKTWIKRIRYGQKWQIIEEDKRKHQEQERVTPSSSVRDPYSFAPQSSSFGGGGAGGNGFGVGVGGNVGGGSEGGGLLEILQAMQMDQFPIYASLEAH